MNKHKAAYVRKNLRKKSYGFIFEVAERKKFAFHLPFPRCYTMDINFEPIFDPFPHILQTTVIRKNKPMSKKMKKQTWVKNVFGDETYYYEAGIKK